VVLATAAITFAAVGGLRSAEAGSARQRHELDQLRVLVERLERGESVGSGELRDAAQRARNVAADELQTVEGLERRAEAASRRPE
jgi:hypothetical protein